MRGFLAGYVGGLLALMLVKEFGLLSVMPDLRLRVDRR
jgi:hypothetical protein